MDNSQLILTEAVPLPRPLEGLKEAAAGKINEFSEQKKKQLARDFESILIGKLLDQMKNTIGDWGLEEDGASKQIQGMFWLFMAREIANRGGFGLWKDIYQSLTSSQQANAQTETLDRNV